MAMIDLVPGGLGTFEGTCVVMRHVHGVSLEAGLACTFSAASLLKLWSGSWSDRAGGRRGSILLGY
jgi:hypothetical protein